MPTSPVDTLHGDHRLAFAEAVELAFGVLGDDAVGRSWHLPSALSGLSVGGLAAHLFAGVRRLEVALDELLPDAPVVVGLAEFCGANRVETPEAVDTGLHATIRADAEHRARHGHRPVVERFVELGARLGQRLAVESLDRLVQVIQVAGGVTPLSLYLASRVVELVVHADDLACSVGLPLVTSPRARPSPSTYLSSSRGPESATWR